VTAAAEQVGNRARASAARRPLRAISVAERFSSPHVALLWLVRLRWHALVALAAAMTLAPWLMGVSVPWLPALALVSGIALSNLACLNWARSGRRVHTAALGALILADTLLLSAALALAGGSFNPFVTLYVIEVTLAALIVDLGWVIAVGVTAVSGYALLLVSSSGAPPALGIESSLLALATTLGINATLVVRIAAAFRQRQAALVSAQREAAQAEKLASLTTLAAGAAHELATPLGCIAVAATELVSLLDTDPAQARIEARSIREQVDRCKHILQRLGARAGSEPGELPRHTTCAEAFERVRSELGARSARLETRGDVALAFDAPLESLAAVLTNLVSNALQASPPEATVTLSLDQRGQCVRFTTSDRGIGIDPALLPRLGEPFFTTKPPGEGLGLGLFLAFRFSRTCGGRLDIESEPGGGTRVHLELPKAWSGVA
jgi:two-component system, sensor histidine kinase RegB